MSRAKNAAAAQRIGQVMAGKYELLRLLGSGGMGAVYEAHHRFTDRRVALKVLHPEVAAVPSVVQRFFREAKAAAAIQHPAIADVLDAGVEADGTPYLVQELLHGEDLDHVMRSRRLAPARFLDLIEELLGALGAAHAVGIVHRDVKPANVFVVQKDGRFHAKLLDFGVARRVQAEAGAHVTQVGTVLGTPYYMSPEQMCGDGVDGRADLWAVGVLLYHGLAGVLPFRSPSPVGLLAEMLKTGPEPLQRRCPQLPDVLCRLVARALASAMDQRYPDAATMAADLRVARGALDPRAPPRRVAPSPTVTEVVRARSPEETPTQGTLPWERELAAIEREIDAVKAKNEAPSKKGKG